MKYFLAALFVAAPFSTVTALAADGENPPIVTQVEFTGSYTFGNDGALIIHAVPGDATSKILPGVKDYGHPHGFDVSFGKLLPHRVCIQNFDFATKSVEYLGDDRYRVEFSIGPNVSPGDYDLCGFAVSDQFNNDAKCQVDIPFPNENAPPVYACNGSPTTLSALHIHVTHP